MSDDRIVISSGSALSPETVVNRTFASSFRGYDQAEVRVFLKRVADELTTAAQREAQLRESLHDAMTRAAHPELDEEILTNALGERTARLLTNARETATAIVSDAETRAARMLQEGEGRIARMRAEAETLLARRAEEAERLATGLRQAAESDARTLRERARADAQAEVEAARSQGREMVNEAKELRERMLTDLLRRRRAAEAQVEQLRLAHQRLLEAYGVVRRTLEEATGELSAAEAETRPVLEAASVRAEGPGPAPVDAPPAPDHGRHRRSPGGAPPFSPGPAPGEAGAAPDEAAPPPPAEPESPPPPEPASERQPASKAGDEAPPEQASETQPASKAESAASLEPEGPPPSPAPSAPPDVPAQTSAAGRPPTPPPDDPGGVGALGGGAAAAAERERKRATEDGKGRRRLPPVDIAAPGEEVRVVQPAEPASTQVEELFARLRAAQQRRDAPDDAASAPPPAPPPAAEAPARESTVVAHRPPAGDGAPPTAAEVAASNPKVADEKALYRRDELLDPIDSNLSRRLKRVLQDEQNEVLDRVRRQRRPVAEATLPDLVSHTEKYRSAVAALLRQAAQTGAAFVSGAGEVNAPADGVEASADGWAAELAIDLVVPLRERLERALQDAGGDEGGDADLSERLSASYRQWKLHQIEQVARHYSNAAFSRGAFEATAKGTTLRWVVDDDGPCPDCEDNALAGPTPKGQAFPTGQAHPPAHPGCRCLLVPTGV